MTSDVLLRDVTERDLPIFFEQQLDPAANQMAAFTARTRRTERRSQPNGPRYLATIPSRNGPFFVAGEWPAMSPPLWPPGRANSKSRTGSEENSGAKGLPPRRSRRCCVP